MKASLLRDLCLRNDYLSLGYARIEGRFKIQVGYFPQMFSFTLVESRSEKKHPKDDAVNSETPIHLTLNIKGSSNR